MTECSRNWTLATLAAAVFSVVLGATLDGYTPLASVGASHCVNEAGFSACFAPGTTPEQMASAIARLRQRLPYANYEASSRWTSTSTNGSVPTGPITLTYSFVPDFDTGNPGTSNTLHATLDGQFGSRSAWQNIFRQMFESWSQSAGITFVETNDDGAPWPDSPGLVGVRGDIRIVAQAIDGPYNVLAFNYFPNFGDMAIDSAENWADATSGYRFMRNTLMHELGHGLGLDHVAPLDNTKLMEPFLNTNFLGPQDDDIRGAQWNYGDSCEPNASADSAKQLGPVSTAVIADASLNRSSDVDWYSIQVAPAMSIQVVVTPVGGSYNVGPDGGSPQPVNTAAVQRLRVRIYAPNGTTLLAEETAASAGSSVSASATAPNDAAELLLEVSSAGGANDVQRYTAAFNSGGGSSTVLTVFTQSDSLVIIAASPADQDGNESVHTSGTLTYLLLQTVTLTAPASASNGQGFVHWSLDSVPQPLGQRTISFTMNDDRTAVAEYSNAVFIDVSGPAQIVQGGSAMLTVTAAGGQPPYQVSWSPSASLSSNTGTTVTATPSATTTYTVTVADSGGAVTTAPFTLTVVPPLSVNAGPDRIVAVGSEILMQGSASGGTPPYTYQWSPVTSLTNSTDPETRVNALTSRTYTLTVTDFDGDIATDTMTLTVVPALQLTMPGSQGLIRGQSIALEPAVAGGAEPYQFEWSSNGSAVSSERTLSVSPTASTTYDLRVTDASGQSDEGSVLVVVMDALSVQVQASSTRVQRGQSVQLDGVVSGGRAPFALAWTPPATIAEPTSLSTSATPLETTDYTLTVSDADGQTASASVSVTVDAPVSGQQTNDVTPVAPPVMGLCGLTSTASCLLLMSGIVATGRRRKP